MKIIIGLGNPEARYDRTRHNIGFDVLTAYAEKNGVQFTNKDKFRAQVAELTKNGEKVLLVKPLTYYNDSGESARALLDFYKAAPEDFLIIHDDHALPFGTIRTREQGSDAGNNGIKSINSTIGPTTRRIRIGTHSELRNNLSDADYVLSKFSKNESSKRDVLEATAHRIIDQFIDENFTITTHLIPTQ